MSKLNDLRNDIRLFLANVTQGNKYHKTKPKKEKGLQFELYRYLKEKGYAVVYELELPELGQYLQEEKNEAKTFGHEEGSLVPDLVVNLGEEGFACFELKYDELDDNLYARDGKKCKVYVEHCTDVHYAGYIDLYTGTLDEYKNRPCKDPSYSYSYYYENDNSIDESGLNKMPSAYSIKSLWLRHFKYLNDGNGEFAEYE